MGKTENHAAVIQANFNDTCKKDVETKSGFTTHTINTALLLPILDAEAIGRLGQPRPRLASQLPLQPQ
ncbi:hypothetical protein ACFL2V_11980 [Pseudomonadota bacterium]